MTAPVLHCWEGNEQNDATCLLLDGHEGAHDFTPDSEITVSFAPTTSAQTEEP